MQIKIVHLPNGSKRIVSGQLVPQLDLDYTQNLADLKRDIQFALSVLLRYPEFEHQQNVRVQQDSHHLEIMADNVEKLDWLMVEDEWHGFLNALSQLNHEDKKDLDEILPLKTIQHTPQPETKHA